MVTPEQNKLKKQKRADKGVCVICGTKQPKPRCKSCQDCMNYMKEYRRKAIEKGICGRCRKEPIAYSAHCEACKTKLCSAQRKKKVAVYDHYGWRCVCCGVEEEAFLSIDHVNNDGAAHRKTVASSNLYHAIIKEGFPDKYQVLCFNCQWGKRVHGVCPHKQQEALLGIFLLSMASIT